MTVIAAGSRLGPYEVISRLGAGGMGEVWKARDSRLDRSVAIKILPSEFADDAQLKVRFEREAKTISQLSHPNICTLFDVGDGYLVMELLEGESLADRLARGRLPLAEVFRYGAQIGDALERAHRAGVVHRDLKPGNIMLTKSGAKLLDFGLAKSAVIQVSGDGATVQKPLTQEGTILGTFQYMAPEQLEAQEADARTDLFAFGAVLYEMATGQRAFQGKTKTSLIAAIVREQPRPISQLQPLTPVALEHIVAKCLEKDPDDRWQSAHDVAEQLRWAGDAGSQEGMPATMVPRRSPMRFWMIAAIALLAGVTVGVLVLHTFDELRRIPLRFSVTVAEPNRIVSPNAGGAAVVSPDGRSILFVGQDAVSVRRLYLRRLDEFDPVALALSEGAAYPFWSPDGQSVGFFANGKVKRIDLRGSPPVTLADAPDGRGGTWSKNGTILYAPTVSGSLMTVPAKGGAPKLATQLPAGVRSHRFPSFFLDGDHYAFFSVGTAGLQGISLGSLASGRISRIVEGRVAPVTSGKDTIYYTRDGVLLEQHVDLDRLSARGDEQPVAHNVTTGGDRFVQILSAGAGVVVFQTGATEKATFTWYDRSGKRGDVVTEPDDYADPAFTAAESKLVVEHSQTEMLREIDLTTGRSTPLTSMNEKYQSPVASADGSHVVANAVVDAKPAIIEIVPGKQRQIVAYFKKTRFPDYLDATGETLLLEGEREDGRGDSDVFVATRQSGFQLQPLLQTPANETRGHLSPNGKFVVYSSDESGRAEVYVQPIPVTGQRWQVTSDGGDQAQWRGDGGELFYLAPDGRMMSVTIKNTSPFQMSEPQLLFATRIAPTSLLGSRNQYLASASGQRFLLLDPVQSPRMNELSVITNAKR